MYLKIRNYRWPVGIKGFKYKIRVVNTHTGERYEREDWTTEYSRYRVHTELYLFRDFGNCKPFKLVVYVKVYDLEWKENADEEMH